MPAEIDSTIFGFSLVNRINQSIHSELEPSELISEIYKQLHDAISFDALTLSLLTDDLTTVNMFVVSNSGLLRQKRPVGSLTRWVIQQRQLFWTPDDRAEPPPVKSMAADTGSNGRPRAYIFLPVVTHDTPIGVMSIQSYTPGAFTDVHVSIMLAIVTHVAVVLENRRLTTEAFERNDESQ
jgi:GAF domain-containing protein